MNRNRLNSGSIYSNSGLKELAAKYRTEKKICRKCYCKLPLNAKICKNKKCHNTDLRLKHELYKYSKKLD